MERRRCFGSWGKKGSVLMIALLVMVGLSLLGMALLTLSSVEHNIAYNAVWAEGAFSAAEAGIQTGINQLSANAQTATQAIPVSTIGTAYAYRSGGRTDSGPQPLLFRGMRVETGYSVAIGTAYNPSGYTFHSYQINATGTGPRNAQREVEVLAEYGPVAQ